MNRNDILVFDVGGSFLRCGLYDPMRQVLSCSDRMRTPSYICHPGLPQQRLRSLLYDSMERMATQIGWRCEGSVSVAMAGPVDPLGTVLQAPTIWGATSEPEPMAERLGTLWPKARVLVANDLSAAGYYFLRRDDEDFCVVTVSSGIGQKVFIGGKPIVGAGGQGGEIGHLRVDFTSEAPWCDCGGAGHLGAVASGRASAHHVRQLIARDPSAFAESALGREVAGDPEALDNKTIAAAFRVGDSWAQRLIRAIATPLGRALAGIHLAVGVERFVVMGGFACALGLRYLDHVAAAASQADWRYRNKDWRQMLELGESNDQAGLLGAGRMALLDSMSDCQTSVREDYE